MENNRVRILHCADFHLDSPFLLVDPADAEKRRMEYRSLLSDVVNIAKENEVSIFLIAGDLFENKYVSRDTVEMIISCFESFPECMFFISPGNADPYSMNSPYRRFSFPKNVHIFGTVKTCVSIPELNTDVYGFGFPTTNYTSSPLSGYPLLNPERINILVCHGDTSSPLSDSGPVSKADIVSSGFDYIALGHNHDATDIMCEGGVRYAYCGSTEGRGFDEIGYKTVYVGEIWKQFANLHKVKVSRRRYENATVSIDGAETKAMALVMIRDSIREFSNDTALRLTLEGNVKEGFLITQEDIGEGENFPYYIDIIDKTMPYLPLSDLEAENTLRGVYYKTLCERINATSDNIQRTMLTEALRYGLSALSDRDIGSV